MIRKSSLLMAVFCYLVLTQCLAPVSSGSGRTSEVLNSLASELMLVRFTEFEAKAKELTEQASAFCVEPTSDSLELTRVAWWNARTPWKQAQIVQFGPVVEYPLRLGPKLEDWPVNIGAVEDLLASELALDQASFDSMGSATRGFPVLEYLLWGKGEETLASLSDDARRCELLVGASGDVHANAKRLVESWEIDWIPQLTDPEALTDGTYDSSSEVVDEWVNRMAFTVENLRVTQLGKPMGDKAEGEPQPDTIESPYSGRSLTDIRDALEGVHQVWEGALDEQDSGIRDLVSKTSLVSEIDALFTSAKIALEEIPETLEETVLAAPEKIKAAQEELKLLQIAIQGELANNVGVTITFNDADGD